MATPGALRKALFDVLNALPDVQVYQKLTEAVNMGPHGCVVVGPMNGDYHRAQGRGLMFWESVLYAIVPLSDYGLATDALDALVGQHGPRSVPEALWTNRSLGLANTDCHAATVTNYAGELQAVGTDHLAAQLNLEIYTRGDS
jgi:hypothetical protein